MRVFVAGATGAIGQHLVPMLTAAGHDVTATTRSPGKTGLIRQLGATPAGVDGLDAGAAVAAVTPATEMATAVAANSFFMFVPFRRADSGAEFRKSGPRCRAAC